MILGVLGLQALLSAVTAPGPAPVSHIVAIEAWGSQGTVDSGGGSLTWRLTKAPLGYAAFGGSFEHGDGFDWGYGRLELGRELGTHWGAALGADLGHGSFATSDGAYRMFHATLFARPTSRRFLAQAELRLGRVLGVRSDRAIGTATLVASRRLTAQLSGGLPLGGDSEGGHLVGRADLSAGAWRVFAGGGHGWPSPDASSLVGALQTYGLLFSGVTHSLGKSQEGGVVLERQGNDGGARYLFRLFVVLRR